MKVISTQIAAINKYKKYLQMKNDKKEDSGDGEYSDDDIDFDMKTEKENENGDEVNSRNHTIPYNVLDIVEIKETEDCNGDDSFIEDDLDFKTKAEMKNHNGNVSDDGNDLDLKINNGEDGRYNKEDLHLEKRSEIENDIEVDNEDSINLKINNGKEDDKKDGSSNNQDFDLKNSTDIAELANDNDDDLNTKINKGDDGYNRDYLDLDLNGDPEVTSPNEDDRDFEMIDEEDDDVGDYNEGKLDSLVSNVLELITDQEDDKEDPTSHDDDNTLYNPDLKMKMEKKEENAEVNYDNNDLDFIYVTNFVKKEPKIKSEAKTQNDPEIKQESGRKYNKAKKKAFFKKRAEKYRTTEKGKEVHKRRSEKYRMSLRDNKGDQEENEDDKITKAVVKTDPEEIKASQPKASKAVVQHADTESDSDSEVMIVGNIDRDYSCKVPNCLADFWFPSQRDKHTESFHKSS